MYGRNVSGTVDIHFSYSRVAFTLKFTSYFPYIYLYSLYIVCQILVSKAVCITASVPLVADVTVSRINLGSNLYGGLSL